MSTINTCKIVAITFTKSGIGKWVFMKFDTKKFFWMIISYRLVENLNQKDHLEGVGGKIM
jgi:hypothetical protein